MLKKKIKKKVLVAMSGGVDSSLAAILLRREGYIVSGATMNLLGGNIYNETNDWVNIYENNIKYAKRVAESLNIPWKVWNFSAEFDQEIIEYFKNEYLAGRTPNPCSLCNLKIKFGLFFEKALASGMDYIATGHYVINEFNPQTNLFNLRKAKDKKKDQSYFLYSLNQKILPHVLFPLGELKKEKVIALAQKYGLENHNKKESQEICFIPDNDYRFFLKNNVRKKIASGNYKDTNGKVLGKHLGVPFYTIGQRKKLGISLNARQYVVKIDAENNEVILGKNSELFERQFKVKNVNIISDKKLIFPLDVNVKIRYNCDDSKATLFAKGKDKILVKLNKPQRAITPGQVATFYQDDLLLGGGIIE